MKKFAVIFAVIFLAFVVNANAQIYDNTTPPSSGSMHIECGVIAPLLVTPSTTELNLGEFVKSDNPYNITTDNQHVHFNVVGKENYGFYYKISSQILGTNANLTLTWTDNAGTPTLVSLHAASLDDDGAYQFTCTVNTVHAKEIGTQIFNQTVEVGYTPF